MRNEMLMSRKWSKTKLYVLYWVGYLLLFTLIEGSTDYDFFNVFRNELISIAPKAIFVWLVLEKLFYDLLDSSKLARTIMLYIALVINFALLMRLMDNYIILRYFLTYWAREPLLSAAPFLYNIIKLQFLLAIPFCVKLYRYFNVGNSRYQQLQPVLPEIEKTFLNIKCDRRTVKLQFDDIYYCESQGNYLEIFTANGVFRTYLSISDLEEKLPPSKFLRIHRSFVVGLSKVGSHNNRRVTIANKNIPIGRSYIPAVRKTLPA